jgi:hypothetical protein
MPMDGSFRSRGCLRRGQICGRDEVQAGSPENYLATVEVAREFGSYVGEGEGPCS